MVAIVKQNIFAKFSANTILKIKLAKNQIVLKDGLPFFPYLSHQFMYNRAII
jgi:hypothetical protein